MQVGEGTADPALLEVVPPGGGGGSPPRDSYPFPGASELARAHLLIMMTDVQTCMWKWTSPWSCVGPGTSALSSHSMDKKQSHGRIQSQGVGKYMAPFYGRNYKLLEKKYR